MSSAGLFIPPYPPRPSQYAPLWRGFFGEYRRNGVHGWPASAFERFDIKRRVLHLDMHFITHPDEMEHFLLTKKDNYVRPRLVQKILQPSLGNGLLTAEGEGWRKQRKAIAPTFAPSAVAVMSADIDRIARAQVAGWEKASARIDLAEEAADITTTIIADALFAGEAPLKSAKGRRIIRELVESAGEVSVFSLLEMGDFNFSPAAMRLRQGRTYLRESLTELVTSRMANPDNDDFFGGLIQALRGDLGDEVARLRAIDNALTFYVAGHETTATMLSWAIYLFAAQPALQDKARDEAQAAITGDPATLADRLPFLRQFVDETMRLYPPVFRIDREALEPDQLGKRDVGKHAYISGWTWLMHRNRALWDNADAFDPERFAPERKAKLHRFQYMPFGAGPRICVGARFAMVEGLIILAHWLSARRFALPPGYQPDPGGTITLRPRAGVPLIVKPL